MFRYAIVTPISLHLICICIYVYVSYVFFSFEGSISVSKKTPCALETLLFS